MKAISGLARSAAWIAAGRGSHRHGKLVYPWVSPPPGSPASSLPTGEATNQSR